MKTLLTGKVAGILKEGEGVLLLFIFFGIVIGYFLSISWLDKALFKWLSVDEALSKTWSTFGSWLIVAGAYSFAKYAPLTRIEPGSFFGNKHFQKIGPYVSCTAIIIALSFILWFSYGTHIEDQDDTRGGGTVVEDFVPSDKERNTYSLKMFLTLFIPSLLGIGANVRENKRGYSKRDDTIPSQE